MTLRNIFREYFFATLIIGIFFVAYTTLSVVRHLHFGSFGFDLGISDQIVWQYSQFKQPLLSLIAYAYTPVLTDHFEPIYIVLAPFYWLYSSPITLLILQSALLCFSAIPVYLLAKQKKLKQSFSYVFLFAYLTFYGIQQAIWFDVHTIVLGAAMLPWFIYFMDRKKYRWALLPFILAIVAKEDVGLLLCLISIIFGMIQKRKEPFLFAAVAAIYSFVIFFIYFPYMTQDGYRYAGSGGFFDSMNMYYLINTPEKRSVYLYSLGWFGFFPLLSPLLLLPALGDITKYFVIANTLPSVHGLFMHYRVTLAALLVWPAIITVSKIKLFNKHIVAVILFGFVLYLNYSLHVPLTYLTKQWFWTPPSSLSTLRDVLPHVDADEAIAVQNNIVPHLSQRNDILTLWYEQKQLSDISVCGKELCDWLRWNGKPSSLLVDLAPEWDIRHFLADRDAFIRAVENLEQQGVIKVKYRNGTTTLYTIMLNTK